MPLLALSYAAAGYALFQVFARWRREPGWRAALAVLALAAVNVAIWRPLAAGDAAYLRRELDMAALRSAPNDEITPQLWHVQRSRGFFGFPVGLLGDGIPPAMRYRTVQCPADDELCGNSRQTLAVAFASPVQMRAVTVSVRNGRPERPIVVRLLLPDEDGNNPGATLFAGEANEPGADGTWRIALSSPVRRRLLLLEFEAALPRDFEIERVRFE
jgi:hypothetical protein